MCAEWQGRNGFSCVKDSYVEGKSGLLCVSLKGGKRINGLAFIEISSDQYWSTGGYKALRLQRSKQHILCSQGTQNRVGEMNIRQIHTK